MAKYRKKPIEIEAFRLGIDFIPDWFMDRVTSNDIIIHGSMLCADIKTLEGVMFASYGDFIIKGVKGEVRKQPAADVVEVVRCKDCKHFTKEMIGDDLECICKRVSGMLNPAPDLYCSYGERKEEK